MGLNFINAPNGTIVDDYIFSTVDDVNTLVAYLSDTTEITLPEDFNGKSYCIGEKFFSGRTDLTDIVIPNSVTGIGSNAFSGCTGLTSITIPSGVKSIGINAFRNCSALTQVNISDLSEWCNIDFEDSYSNPLYYTKSFKLNGEPVTNLVIPDGVTEIKKYAFYNCESIASITVPYSVTSIGTNAFYGCKNLKKVLNYSSLDFRKGWSNGYIANYADIIVNAPNGAVVGDFAFSTIDGVNTLVAYLGNTTEIVLPDSYNGESYCIGESLFNGCTDLTDITIPDSVTGIGDYAFMNCTGLESVSISRNITNIGTDAFRYCTGLTKVSISDLSSWYNINFSNSYANPLYYAKNLYQNGELVTELVIPDDVAEIKNYAFYNCESITDIIIPYSVINIGKNAFSGCKNLEMVLNLSSISFTYNADVVVDAPNGTIVGDFVFATIDGVNTLVAYLGNDTEVVLPEDYNGESYGIGDAAFYERTDLVSIVIPDCVTSIGHYAFYGCTALRDIAFPNSLTSIGADAFYGCRSIKKIEIPNHITTVGYGAFSQCTALESVNLDCRVIEDWFKDNTTIKEIILGDNVSSISMNAFSGCSSIENITIGNGVASIGNNAFYGCATIDSIYITDFMAWCNIDFDGYYANPLYYAESIYLNGEILTELVIPDGVTEIKDYTFYNCKSLESVIVPNTIVSIGDNAFSGCKNIDTIINLSNLIFRAYSSDYGYIAYNASSVVNAANGVIVGDFIFGKVDDTNTMVKYIGNDADVVLPANYDGGNYAIGAEAFKGDSLVNITIPNSVISIKNNAFTNCYALNGVHIGDLAAWCNIDFDSYYSNPLYYAKNLYLNGEPVLDLVIPEGVTIIKDYAFNNYDALASVIIPNSVVSVGLNAFVNCNSLETVVNLSNLVFSRYGYEDGSIPCGANTIVNAYNGTIIGDYVFCTSDGENTLVAYLGKESDLTVTLPDSFNGENYRIGAEVFKNKSLTNIVIPNSVTAIGHDAFAYCNALKGVYITNLSAWCNIDFDGSSANPLYYAGNLYLNDELVDELVIPEDVTIIKDYAFYNFETLTSVTLSNSVKSIGNYAFNGCSELQKVEISDLTAWFDIEFAERNANPLYYADYLYLNGEPITELVVPDGIIEIKDYAFYNYAALESVVIPKSVTKIGNDAFYNWKESIKTVINFSELVFTAGSYEEHGQIAYGADIVKNISNAEFHGDFVFSTLNDETYFVVYLGDETEIVLPDSYNGGEYIIDEYAFALSPDVVSITVPKSVTGIRNNAFENNDVLKRLYMMNEQPPRAVRSTFNDIHYESVTVLVPVGALDIYKSANIWGEFWDIKEFDSTTIDLLEDYIINENTDIYDLSGRKIENTRRGIYIINGKKVFLK